ncbi:MAG: Hsp20/alpha crystallin family protein [Flavitalea sp.]
MALLTLKPATSNFPDLFDAIFQPAIENRANGLSHPPTNVLENKDGFILEMNAPGRNKEDFNILIEKNLLTIRFEEKKEQPNPEQKLIRKEFSLKSFKRSFSLDDQIDSQSIQAKYENGILKLWLPKKEEKKESVKQITIS